MLPGLAAGVGGGVVLLEVRDARAGVEKGHHVGRQDVLGVDRPRDAPVKDVEWCSGLLGDATPHHDAQTPAPRSWHHAPRVVSLPSVSPDVPPPVWQGETKRTFVRKEDGPPSPPLVLLGPTKAMLSVGCRKGRNHTRSPGPQIGLVEPPANSGGGNWPSVSPNYAPCSRSCRCEPVQMNMGQFSFQLFSCSLYCICEVIVFGFVFSSQGMQSSCFRFF